MHNALKYTFGLVFGLSMLFAVLTPAGVYAWDDDIWYDDADIYYENYYDDCYYSDCYGGYYDYYDYYDYTDYYYDDYYYDDYYYDDYYYDDCYYGCYDYGYTDYYYPSTGYSSSVSYSTYPVVYPTSYTPTVTTSIVPIAHATPITVSSGTPSTPGYTYPTTGAGVTYSNNGNTYIDNSYTDNSINNSFNNSFNTGTNIDSPAAVAAGTSISIVPLGVATPQYNTSYTYSTPTCTISLSNYGSISGQTTLIWNSYDNATSASISSVGSVGTYGSRTVYPYNGQVYTMTVYGQNGNSSTCQTAAYLTPAYYTPTYTTPTYTTPTYTPINTASPYVALSQIPYTGFDLGPIGNALYWFSLLAFAAAGAYLVVYYRGGMFSFMSFAAASRPSPIKVTLPVAPKYQEEDDIDEAAIRVSASDRVGTEDRMDIVSRSGQMPRIVISRA